MKKINVLWIILKSIFLLVFNALFFILGDGAKRNAPVWISYGFIHFAYLMLLVTPMLIRRAERGTAILGFSLYSISSVYFSTAFVTGLVFILVSPESYKAAFTIQLCIAGLYGIILVSNMIADERTADAEEKRQDQIAYVKDASAKLKGLLEKINDKDAKKKVERVYDALYSSPVKSHPDMAQIENHILQSINELEVEISAENTENIISLADSLLTSVNERNSQAKRFF